MRKPTAESRARGDVTRDSLIASALDVFAREGFHGATTRAIAEAAGVQQALIGYHFRSKEGLYIAVFKHIAAQLGERLGPVIDAIEAELDTPGAERNAGALREHHLALLLRMIDGMLGVMVRDESAAWSQLIIREQREPTEAFEAFYEGFAKRMVGLLTRLVTRIRGEADDDDARLLVATMLGQVLVFRIMRAAVLRQLDWSTIGEKELARIRRQVRRNLTAQLAAPADARPPAPRAARRGKR